MVRSSRQIINKDTVDLTALPTKLDTTNIYKIIHLTTAEFAFLSSLHIMFTKTGHILGHTIYLGGKKRNHEVCS